MSLQELRAVIHSGREGAELVPPALFFEGNEDHRSIAAGLDDHGHHRHPGIGTFAEVLEGLEEQSAVDEVLLEVEDDWGPDEEEEWPTCSLVLVYGSIERDHLAHLVTELLPEPFAAEDDGTFGPQDRRRPPGAPELGKDQEVWLVRWPR